MDSQKTAIFWLCAILLITTVCLFPVLRNDFINRDDPAYVTDNALIKELSLGSLQKIFSTSQYEGDYHPVTLLLFAVQYHFFQDRPQGYHAVSLLLHLAVTALVFFVFIRLTGSRFIAIIVSALFGIHPEHVEAVAWVSQQKDLLYALFYLTALIYYTRYLRSNHILSYLIALVLFILSLLSKTMAVSFAGVIILIDIFCRRTLSKKLFLEKIPFVVLAIAFGWWSIVAHRAARALLDVVSYGAIERAFLAGFAAYNYLAKIIVPINLSAYYPYPFLPGHASALFAIFPLGLILLTIGVIYTLRSTRTIAFGYGWFFLNIAAIMQLVPLGGAFIADRYTYLASLGLFYVIGASCEQLREKKVVGSSFRKNIALFGLGLIIVVLGALTWKRTTVWKDSVTLWTDVISKYPDVAFIYAYRGNARHIPEEVDSAFADFNKALYLKPDLGIASCSRGNLYATVGNHNAAIADYTEAIRLHYRPDECYVRRGNSFTALGRYDDAVADLTHAIQLNPDYTDAYYNRANVYLTVRQYRSAVADLDTVLRRNSDDIVSLYNRGLARQLLGDNAGGCADLRQAAEKNFPAAVATYNKYCR